MQSNSELRRLGENGGSWDGRGSRNSVSVEFGLGKATTIQQITIRWPNGFVQRLSEVALDQILSVTEPAICQYGTADLNCDREVDAEDMFLFQRRWEDLN